ncbi:AMP-binding protein [Labrys wisconsinensis]|uniref:Long-chain-fatty-acid--CoA ligase n=1 Tax=Labrys wisconsinensis TaxID=425677 RepID=A0ABU0JCG5_9HYPH|nr:AMP-binding protein [Labrys wisconsinensis]MDQ0471285.1 long-chain acyl-CoA synthetase [Labrys wisconsinensis]
MTGDGATDGEIGRDRPWTAHYPPDALTELAATPYRLLGDIARDRARQTPWRIAVTCVMPNGMAGSLSFAAVDRLSDAFAAYLREDLKLPAGERVAIQIPNGLAYPVVAFGVFKAGCILVNVNPLYTSGEMAKIFADAEPAVLVVIDMFADKVAAALAERPAVLAEGPRPQVVLTSAAELFPAWPRTVIGLVQTYVRRQIPPARFAHVRLAAALRAGRRHMLRRDRSAAYAEGIEPNAVACLQYTGGTTGVSKGAMLTHRNLVMNAAQTTAFAGAHISSEETILTALPLYHIFAFTVNFLAFYMRSGRSVLIPNPRPLTNLRKALEGQGITFITGVNTLFNGLLNEDWFREAPPPTLRLSVAGGMALQAAVAQRWAEVTRRPIIEGYGLTETSPVLTFNPFGAGRIGTIGVPIPLTELKCVDDAFNEVPRGEPGELAARGPQVMAGYWRRRDETALVMRGDWLLTGDIAIEDEAGFFRLVDRRKDMILVSGFNVYPNEIEDVLAKLPGVKEAAVVGVPDGAAGEAPKAFVVRSDPALTAEAVRAHCKQHLTGYKVPKHVEFRDELPKSNVGKILRRELRADPSSQVAAIP